MDYIKANSMKVLILVLGISAALILIISLLNSEPKTKDISNEKNLLTAARSYYNDNKFLLPSNNKTIKITGKELANNNYIKDNSECASYVTITNVNDEYFYSAIVKCNKESDSKILYNELIKNVVENEEGLNKINNEYYFKGETINNNLTFANKKWQIIKIDENENIKIIFNDRRISTLWDDRYNLESKRNYGINNFALSRIKDYLDQFINENFNSSNISNLALFDLCVGKRKENNISKDGALECSEKIEAQLIGLIQANEYLLASNDPGCTSKSMALCQNYNYIKSGIWTINGSLDSTFKVFLTSAESGLYAYQASRNFEVKPVITLRKDAIIKTGDGSFTKPYIIE